MATAANSITKLRKLYRARFVPFNAESFHKALDAESDRAAILLVATALDDMLTFKVASKIQPPPKAADFDNIFRFEGPLGTFSSKIEIASHFGVLDKITVDQLTDIREMRNACAHYRNDISLKTPELVNVLKRIFHPKGVFAPQDDSPTTLRNVFIFECSVIMLRMAPDIEKREEAVHRFKEAAAAGGVQLPLPHKSK